jgi:hypothetical protein
MDYISITAVLTREILYSHVKESTRLKNKTDGFEESDETFNLLKESAIIQSQDKLDK